MKDYRKEYNNRIPEILSDATVRTSFKEHLSSDAKTAVAFNRWERGILYPPINEVISLSMLTGYSVSYLLGETDIKSPCYGRVTVIENTKLQNIFVQEKVPEINNNRLLSLIENGSCSMSKLIKLTDTCYDTIKRTIDIFPNARVNTLLSIAEALDVSIDYLLGLSDWKTWEEYKAQLSAPLSDVQPGEIVKAHILSNKKDYIYCYKTHRNSVITINPQTDETEELPLTSTKFAKMVLLKL